MIDEPPLVLHVIHHLVVGGMENGLVNLINRLPATSFRHAIVCVEGFSDFRSRLRRSDVEVIALNRTQSGLWRMRRDLYDLCRRLKPSIVHTRNLSGLDALLPARTAGVRCCVHSEHGWDVDDIQGTRLRPALLRRIHSPLVNRYVAVSKNLERYLVDRVGLGASRVTQIYNGVDVQLFSPAKCKAAGILPNVDGRMPSFVVGTVGRIQPIKDQRTLLSAFAKLLHAVPHLRSYAILAIVGDGPLLSELRSYASSLGIADYVWFAGMRVDVQEILCLFDVFVLPSLNEGISNTILEAMACGLPVIATDVGGNSELVKEGKTGSLVPAGDSEAIMRVLARYAEQPEQRRELGLAARAQVERQFSLDVMVARYSIVYRRLLDTKCRGPSVAIDSTTPPV